MSKLVQKSRSIVVSRVSYRAQPDAQPHFFVLSAHNKSGSGLQSRAREKKSRRKKKSRTGKKYSRRKKKSRQKQKVVPEKKGRARGK